MTPRKGASADDFYQPLRTRTRFEPAILATHLAALDQARVTRLADAIADYLGKNLKESVQKRRDLSHYRTNPYVMLATASLMGLNEQSKLSQFLVDIKLYTGLETSFGKQVESQVVGLYPIGAAAPSRWQDPPEKLAEFDELNKLELTRAARASARKNSVWREIDKSCVLGDRRYLVSIKSGPNCINDTQVEAMQVAIGQKAKTWLAETKKSYPQVQELDVIVGLTYGTRATTNNKENQILAKVVGEEFVEEDREKLPGVLVDKATGTVRVYRAVGIDFWALIGDPASPGTAAHTYLEVLVALLRALATGEQRKATSGLLKEKVAELALGIATEEAVK